MKTVPPQTGVHRIISHFAQDSMSLAVILTAFAMAGISVRAADTEESWQSISGGYTNQASWSPQISTSGGITNWPANFNGAGVDYAVVVTGAGGNASDACLYTNTDINGTNLLGQLAIGGYGAGAGGGSISNAFIMTGGMLTVTDFTASASAGYAFTIGGNNLKVVSLFDTNYFIMTGGTFNSTNVSGGNNWIGQESNAVNYVYFNGGTANLDGLFMGGYGSGTVTVNGGTVNFFNQTGGGTPGAIALGWEPCLGFTLNLMSGTVNITNKSPSINFHANTGSAGTFTMNVSGGALNASEINFGNTPNGVATNVLNFSGGNINLGSGGIVSADTVNNTNRLIMSGGTFSTLPGQNWTFSSSLNPIVNVLTNTGTNVVFAPLAGQSITLSGIISGPGAMNIAGPGLTVLNAAMAFTGGLTVSGGTLAIGAAQTESLGLNILSGGNLQIDNVNNALVDNPISLPGGSGLIFSNTTPILFGNTVTGGGSLLVDGGGAVTNNGNLQITGNTLVNAGDLVVIGSGTISSPVISIGSGGTLDVSQLPSFNLASGQTLTGVGTVIGPAGGNINFTSGSTLAAGLSTTNMYPLTIENNLVLEAGSADIVIVNKSPAIANDEVVGLNSVTMGGTLLVTNIGTAPLAAGDAITIFSAASYNTNGFKIVPATPGAGLAWAVTNGTLYVVGSINPNAPVITNEPVSATLNPGTIFTNSVGASGEQPLAYQWYQSPSDTAIPGATNATLVFDPVIAADATNYFVEVSNGAGSVFSTVATIDVNSTPVVLTQFPITYTNLNNTNFMTLYAGANPTFSISASSTQPATVFYQWYTNGVGVGGADNSTVTLTNVPAGSLAVDCIVTNGGGAATNVVWAATVLEDPTNVAGQAPYPQAVLALKPIGYWRLNEPESGGGDPWVVAYDYVSGNDALYTNVVLGNTGYSPITDPSGYSAEFGTYSNFNSFAGYVGTNVDFGLPAGSNAEFTVECWVNFNKNTVCGLVTKGYGNGGEEFSLDNDSGSLPRFLVRVANGSAYIAVGTPFTPTPGNWYNLVGVCDEANSNLSFYVNGTLYATTNTSVLYQGGILTDLTNNMIIGARTASQAASLVSSNGNQTVGYMSDVAIFNYALSSTQIANAYLASAGSPYFTQQPVGVYVGKGSNVTLTASADGAPVLSYQWYETNLTAQTGHAVSGQTTSTLTINDIQSSDSFYLNVANSYGSTNSAVATLGVYSSPLITGQFPITYSTTLNTNYMTLYAGANPTFSVGALGYGSLYYQWFTDGAAVTGATNASFTGSDPQAGTVTTWCIVTNYLGSATSAVWSASVLADPNNSSSGLASYPQSVLALNPIGYWRLNEPDDGNFDGNPGAVAHDYAGGNDGLYTNVYLQNIDGGTGYNPTEDPTDTSVQLGYYSANNSDINYIGTNIDFSAPAGSNAEFSVECWVQFTVHSICGLITKGSGNGGEEFSMDADATGGADFRFFVRDASGATHTAESTFTPALNTWYHMVGVCDEANSNVAFYVDGQLAGIALITPRSGIFSDVGYNMIIGARSSSLVNAEANNQNNQTIGYMNDVAVFKSALTPGQIAGQYDAGGGTIAPYFVPTQPPTNASGVANSTLTIPATAIGTPPISYYWTNITTGAAIATGVTNTATTLNASLSYPDVPASWNGDQLQVTASNAYGTTNVLVTLAISTVNTSPTNIVFGVTNGQLTLSWPADHTGWQLQAQTNKLSVGVSTNWVNISGSTTTNQVVIPINLTSGCVFYRLVYP